MRQMTASWQFQKDQGQYDAPVAHHGSGSNKADDRDRQGARRVQPAGRARRTRPRRTTTTHDRDDHGHSHEAADVDWGWSGARHRARRRAQGRARPQLGCRPEVAEGRPDPGAHPLEHAGPQPLARPLGRRRDVMVQARSRVQRPQLRRTSSTSCCSPTGWAATSGSTTRAATSSSPTSGRRPAAVVDEDHARRRHRAAGLAGAVPAQRDHADGLGSARRRLLRARLAARAGVGGRPRPGWPSSLIDYRGGNTPLGAGSRSGRTCWSATRWRRPARPSRSTRWSPPSRSAWTRTRKWLGAKVAAYALCIFCGVMIRRRAAALRAGLREAGDHRLHPGGREGDPGLDPPLRAVGLRDLGAGALAGRVLGVVKPGSTAF